jgi:fructoselysine 6-kinase
MKLIALGDNVVDIYEDRSMMYPGGNALNVAVMARRNGAEQAAYLGVAGDDEASEYVLACCREEGLDISRVRRAYGPCGWAAVRLTPGGDRVFVGTNRDERVQSLLTVRLTEADLKYIASFDVAHTSVNGDMDHELPRLGVPVSYDFSTRNKWDERLLERVCPHVTYAFFSGSEMEEAEIGALADRVHGYGVRVVCVTRGEREAICSCGGRVYRQKPLPVRVVDTMGAGDSFIAGFLVALIDGGDVARALEQAARSAAVTCGHYGSFGRGKPL